MPESGKPTTRPPMQSQSGRADAVAAIPSRPPLGRATAVLCVLTALAGLLAYSPIPLAKMVEAEHPLLALATSAMAAALVAAAVMAAAYRENRSRLIASVLAIASGTLLLATSVSYREALKPVFPNGGFGDAMSIGITSLDHWGSGLAAITLGVFFAISFRNHRGKGEDSPPTRRERSRNSPAAAIIISVVITVLMIAPFALMACDKLDRMHAMDEEWNRQHADVIALFGERGIPFERSSSFVDSGLCDTSYGEWDVRYDLELECFTASSQAWWAFMAERGTCGTSEIAEDLSGLDKRLYLVVDRVDAKALDEASRHFPRRTPGLAGEVVDMADGRTLSADEIAALKEQAALEAIRHDRGFPQGPEVLDHKHWDDPSGREWVLCVFGKGRSFAYTPVFGDDLSAPEKTLVATESVDAVKGIRIEEGDEVVEVARLDAGTLAGLGVECGS